MASTTANVSVTCPNCAKVLRLSARPAKGKKIKCPSCEVAFLPELDDAETAIQEQPSAKAKSSSSKSAGKKSHDEDDGPPQRRKRREEDEEEDDKPSRKKKTKKSGSMMMVVLLLVGGGFLFLSCGGIGLAAFVWPGFMLSTPAEAKVANNKVEKEIPKEKEKEKDQAGDQPKEAQQPVVQGNFNLTAYVLADATVAMGCNIKGLRENNQGELIASAIDFLTKGNQQGMPAEFTEIMRGCEKVMVSAVAPMGGAKGKGPPMPAPGQFGVPSKLAIVAMLTPESFVKLKQMPGLGAEEKLAGKYGIYRLTGGGKRQILTFPAARIIVLGDCTDADMTALLDGASQGTAGPIAKMSAKVEQTHFWIAGVLDGESRKLLNELPLTPPPGAPPQAVQGLQTLPKLNGACVGVERGAGGNWNVQFHADFADAGAASVAKDALDALKTYALKEMAEDKSAPSYAAAVIADANTLTFSSQGTTLSGTLTVNAKTVDEVMAGDRNPPKQVAKSDGSKTDGRPPLDGVPKKDGLPKVDGVPKRDLPKSDGIKEIPKGGPGVQSYTVTNLAVGKNEREFNFQQGQRVTINVNNTLNNPATDVNLMVFQGNMKAPFKSDLRPASVDKNCFVEFIVPTSGAYRVVIENRGPGIARSCRVTVTVQ